MKKVIGLMMAIMMMGSLMLLAGCGQKVENTGTEDENTQTEQTQEATTVETTESSETSQPEESSETSESAAGGDITMDTYIGNWYDSTGSTATLSIYQARGAYYADVVWNDGQGLDDSWTMECTFDPSTGELTYKNGVRNTNVSDDQGNSEGEEVYTDGTGNFEYQDGAVYWYDDKEQAGEGLVFVLN